jgi:hypothetical protein
MENNSNILSGYVRQSRFAVDNDTCERTIARYRSMGLPFLMWSGEVWIHVEGAREWLESRVKRRNQPRQKRLHQQQAGVA